MTHPKGKAHAERRRQNAPKTKGQEPEVKFPHSRARAGPSPAPGRRRGACPERSGFAVRPIPADPNVCPTQTGSLERGIGDVRTSPPGRQGHAAARGDAVTVAGARRAPGAETPRCPNPACRHRAFPGADARVGKEFPGNNQHGFRKRWKRLQILLKLICF